MSVYKNIDGTSKKSFKISSRGVELTSEFLFVDENTGKRINKLIADGRCVFTEDNKQDIFIERRYIERWEETSEGCKFIMRYYSDKDVTTDNGVIKKGWNTDEIIIKTGAGAPENSVQVQGNTTTDNFAVFGENNNEIKDSGYRILSKVIIDEKQGYLPEDNPSVQDDKQIPTFGVVRQYVEGQAQPLALRQTGENATNYRPN